MRRNLALGAHGEELAAKYLTAAGMTIAARNWRCRYGELDIVARAGESIVFVEVKTRSGSGFGRPAEAVTRIKQARIRKLAMLWLAERAGPWVPVRFDVVEVLVPRSGAAQIEPLQAVF